MAAATLKDGRRVVTFANDAEMSAALCSTVQECASAAIAAKGCFSLIIPAGSVVKALGALRADAVDFSKVHVFFTGERLGVNKSYFAALDAFATKCGCQVYAPMLRPLWSLGEPLPGFAVQEAAGAYAALLRGHPALDNSGPVPACDLMLLGVGGDGHCGSLHPGSAEIRATGEGKVAFAMEAKNQIALSMDVMKASKKVILAACGSGKADAVAKALTGRFDEWQCPAGLVVSGGATWYVDTASTASYTPA